MIYIPEETQIYIKKLNFINKKTTHTLINKHILRPYRKIYTQKNKILTYRKNIYLKEKQSILLSS